MLGKPRGTHLKDDNPGKGNVVKVDGTFVGVAVPCMTPGVVLVPVNTESCYTDAAIGQRLRAQTKRLAIQDVIFVQAACLAPLTTGWHIGARHDAIVNRKGADKRPLIILISHVVRPRETDSVGARRVEEGDNDYKDILKQAYFKKCYVLFKCLHKEESTGTSTYSQLVTSFKKYKRCVLWRGIVFLIIYQQSFTIR